MTLDDLADALAIQQKTYPSFLIEDAQALSSRIIHPHSYCLVAIYDGKVEAYVLAHGWRANAPPSLGGALASDVESEVFFLHDLAVAPAARGSRIGRQLIACALNLAERDGLAQAELIAVTGAAPYWCSLGFTKIPMSPEMTARVADYGEGPCWMTRALAKTSTGKLDSPL